MSDLTLRRAKGSSPPDYTVYLYAWEDDDRSILDNDVASGTARLCDQLKSEGIINGYRVYEYETNLVDEGLAINNDMDDMHDNFGDFIDNRWTDRPGTHLSVSDEISGGKGNSPYLSSRPAAFAMARHATVGTSSYSRSDRTQNTVIHEILHTITNNEIDEVDDMIGDVDCCESPVNRDHFLGTLDVDDPYSNDGPASPLLSSYGQKVWSNGYCSVPSDYTKTSYSTDLIACERAAVDYTIEHDKSQHQ